MVGRGNKQLLEAGWAGTAQGTGNSSSSDEPLLWRGERPLLIHQPAQVIAALLTSLGEKQPLSPLQPPCPACCTTQAAGAQRLQAGSLQCRSALLMMQS